MKKLFFIFLMIGLIFGNANAATNEHYVNGVEGIKCGTLPPPGFYIKLYSVYVTADEMIDSKGKEFKLGGAAELELDATIFALVPRFVWISNFKILGADYGADILIPFVSADIKAETLSYDKKLTGMGDIAVEPFILAWHGTWYDAGTAIAFFVPVGKYKGDPDTVATNYELSSPGKDMWTLMFTLAGTVYFDTDKTWTAAILSRYEIHTQQDKMTFEAGDDFHFEWGLGKTIAKIIDVGVGGYCQWQITGDNKKNALSNKKEYDKAFAAGPHIQAFIPPPYLMMFSLNCYYEYYVRGMRPKGITTCFSVTKIL